MFTGIVEQLGTVTGVEQGPEGARLRIEAPTDGLAVGGSVAVNGTCLTAVEVTPSAFSADVVGETLRRTALGSLRPGDKVNLERPMGASGRFDGHMVQGHVDGVGRVEAAQPDLLRVSLPDGLGRYVVEKGSIAVDGVSLTVAAVGDRWFEVALIPHTLEVTTLGRRTPGDPVNLEVDILAKYVERLLDAHQPPTTNHPPQRPKGAP